MAVADKQFVKAQEQLGQQLKEYAGKWVAISGDAVVAHADSAKALLEQVDSQKIEGIYKVPNEARTAFL